MLVACGQVTVNEEVDPKLIIARLKRQAREATQPRARTHACTHAHPRSLARACTRTRTHALVAELKDEVAML